MSLDDINPRSVESREWFNSNVETIRRGMSRDKVMRDPSVDPVTTVSPGMMYLFFYDPKGSKTLPYYDSFPLILLVDVQDNGMTGLNLHYLPIHLRQNLFYGLLNRVSDRDMNRDTYIRMTYNYLKSVGGVKEYKPCFKKYLTNHIRGNIAHIPANEWETAVHLPLALFRKESESTVHRRSEEMIKRF